MVCVLVGKTRWWRLPQDGIMFFLSSRHPGGASKYHRWTCGGVSSVDLSLVDLLGSDRSSSMFVCFQVEFFRSTLIFNGDGCCFGVLVLWGLSIATSRLSTTTCFVRFR